MNYRRRRKDRTKFIGVQIAEDEKDLISEAADICDESISDFCRRVLIQISSKLVGDEESNV